LLQSTIAEYYDDEYNADEDNDDNTIIIVLIVIIIIIIIVVVSLTFFTLKYKIVNEYTKQSSFTRTAVPDGIQSNNQPPYTGLG
jgi:flagellar basal body-associated protein FliL